MIINNLFELLSIRGLSITKVSNDTGISRTTLTAMCKDNSKECSLRTLDTLCDYLNCSLSDLLIRDNDRKDLKDDVLIKLVNNLSEEKKLALYNLLKND